ncbi:DUF1592 domain-containing protein [Verrucomicrobiaceae bacterium 5K15]|uniref:DUF1592 domain-containing protein n=1 Tax=Oceaniferula flava TaxID=2800421 RepID=A0AAE2VCS4_9BACT|nr:DUF1592 domain-containing protein [Oceaniferula flavus]MBK1855431.1 DUF1592 domain-containing protein [Oceaniferula flavus]MBM1136737.1 DUF1592 domain-containing protein [Oceaniferula flavus]
MKCKISHFVTLMFGMSLRLATLSWLAAAWPCLVSQAAADPYFPRDAVPVLRKYCYECHGEEKQEAGIAFHNLLNTDQALRSHKLLAKIAEQMENDDMPPFEADDFPDDSEKLLLTQSIDHLLNVIRSGKLPKTAGRVTIRRLNRNEYNYTVRDLFGVNFQPGKTFPADASGGEGFDNTADTLFLPPVLMESYLKAAIRVMDAVYQSDSLRKKVIFVSAAERKNSPRQAARKVLSYHAALAFRRKVEDAEIDPLLATFDARMKQEPDFEKALRTPLTSLLVNPKFLFRIQHDEPGKKQWPLNDFELATRLSYFLWSSMPDPELFKLANEGKLRDPGVLSGQIRRMLASKKSTAMARHFAGQWIGFEELIDRAEPDKKRFPQFTRSLRASMYHESVAFFNHLIRENRPVTELIDADYAFLNAELAAHYGIPGVTGNQLRKVALSDRNRGGIIGMGSVLVTTSLPLRTSPVKRGTWILSTILGSAPPPPPPDAGELPADDKSSEGLSFRKQLEIHRSKAKCASCHAKIDPLGFGLENYDPIGRWRSVGVNGQAVDSAAELPDGTRFSSPSELKSILMQDKDKIARNLCRKMLAYALGRPLEYYDEPVVSDLLKTIKTKDYHMQALIIAIAESHPFQNRSSTR